MLVTPKDALIADFAIKSYCLLERYNNIIPFTLKIYANCLTHEQKEKYFSKWEKYPFVKIHDNMLDGEQFKVNTPVHSHDGASTSIEGKYERGCLIWTNELQKADTEYWATVDADFEIRKPHFIIKMIEQLDNDEKLIAVSSDYSPTQCNIYEPYSKTYCNLIERWHTWFVIYKNKAKECTTSHFYYSYNDSEGIENKMDDACRFQHDLISQFGYKLAVVDAKYQNQFIHYGAFSKNKTINEKTIDQYRRLAILQKIGCGIDLNNKILRKIVNFVVNKPIKKIAKIYLSKLFDFSERYTYHLE